MNLLAAVSAAIGCGIVTWAAIHVYRQGVVGIVTGLTAVRGFFQTECIGMLSDVKGLTAMKYALATLVIAAVPTIQFASSYPDRRVDSAYGQPLDLWRGNAKNGKYV